MVGKNSIIKENLTVCFHKFRLAARIAFGKFDKVKLLVTEINKLDVGKYVDRCIDEKRKSRAIRDMEIEITEKEQGMVLRDFLRREMGFSRAAITMLKQKETGLMVNGIRVTVRAVLHTKDRLYIDLNDASTNENEALVPIDLPLSVI